MELGDGDENVLGVFELVAGLESAVGLVIVVERLLAVNERCFESWKTFWEQNLLLIFQVLEDVIVVLQRSQ